MGYFLINKDHLFNSLNIVMRITVLLVLLFIIIIDVHAQGSYDWHEHHMAMEEMDEEGHSGLAWLLTIGFWIYIIIKLIDDD